MLRMSATQMDGKNMTLTVLKQAHSYPCHHGELWLHDPISGSASMIPNDRPAKVIYIPDSSQIGHKLTIDNGLQKLFMSR